MEETYLPIFVKLVDFLTELSYFPYKVSISRMCMELYLILLTGKLLLEYRLPSNYEII